MPKLLPSQQNTKRVEKLVRRAAAVRFGRGKADPVFEHGHWWIQIEGDEGTETFDVVDSSPSIAYTGFDFEAL